MKILDKSSEGLKRTYTILIPQEELDAALTAKLKDTAKRVRLDGFRPGKVPVDIVKRMYGDALLTDAHKSAISVASNQVIRDEQLTVAFNYYTSDAKASEDGLEFTLKLEVIPSFELQDISSIKLVKKNADIQEYDIDEVVDSIRKSRPNWIADESITEVSEGHKIIVDMSQIVSDSKQKGHDIKALEIVVGDTSLVGDFWQHLIGAHVNETRSFEIQYPADFGNKKLAGKTHKYEATVTQILKSTEFELNDEFAQAFGYEDLSKLRAWARAQLVARYDVISKDLLRREFLEELSKQYDFDVPDNMVEVELNDIEQHIKAEAKRLGKEFTPEIKEECRKIAIQRVRLGLVVSKFAKQEKMYVARNEINAAIKNIASMYPGQEKQIVEMYQHQTAMNIVAGQILESKVVTRLLDKIETSEINVSAKKLVDLDEEPFDFLKDDEQPVKADEESKPKKAAAKKTTKAKAEEASEPAAAKEEEAAPKKKRTCKAKKPADKE